MGITIHEHTYVECIWFADNDYANVMAVLTREPDACWRGQLRVRRFVDKRVFNSNDERHSFYVDFRPDVDVETAREQYELSLCGLVAALLGPAAMINMEVIPVHGGPEAFANALKSRPWAHLSKPD